MTQAQWFDNPRFDTADTTDAWYARRARKARDEADAEIAAIDDDSLGEVTAAIADADRYKVVYVRRSDGAVSSSQIFYGDEGAETVAWLSEFQTDEYTKAIVVGF